MALTTPILLSKVAFDASQQSIFEFSVSGGSQVTGNTLRITNNITGLQVYQETQTSFKFEHILAGGTLTNGIDYTAQVRTIDASSNVSSWSNSILFRCFSVPVLSITNMPAGNIVANTTFNFEATYTQAQYEQLNSYNFILYDSSGSPVSSSGIEYVGSTLIPPIVLNHTFSGFENNTVYSIEVNGVTLNGTSVTSGKINFTASYTAPSSYGSVQLENNCDEGYINIISNMLVIGSESNPTPPIFIDNERLDVTGITALSSNYDYVKWISGFEIPEDHFTLELRASALVLGNPKFAKLKGDTVTEIGLRLFKSANYYYLKATLTTDSSTISMDSAGLSAIDIIGRDILYLALRKTGPKITDCRLVLQLWERSTDRSYLWYDVDYLGYTFAGVDSLGLTWALVDEGGW